MITRFSRPRIIRTAGSFMPRIALSYMTSQWDGFNTIMSYAVWTPFGIKRIWAF